jgi:hypothetical protein
MSSVWTLRLKRRRAFSTDSPSCNRTSANSSPPTHHYIEHVRVYSLIVARPVEPIADSLRLIGSHATIPCSIALKMTRWRSAVATASAGFGRTSNQRGAWYEMTYSAGALVPQTLNSSVDLDLSPKYWDLRESGAKPFEGASEKSAVALRSQWLRKKWLLR